MTPLDEALRRFAATARTGSVLVALDFDGTLAPFVDNPVDSRPLPDASRALERLAASSVCLALVSGRALDGLVDAAGPREGTHLVGSHGAERGLWTHAHLERADLTLTATASALLSELTARLTELATGTTARVESKPASVVLHTRTASAQDAPRLTGAAAAIGDRPGVDVLHGKNVVELAVLDVSKGQALRTLRTELCVSDILYAGDDVTDERAFTALERSDITIKVGAGRTAARWRVDDPAALAAVLTRLADLIG